MTHDDIIRMAREAGIGSIYGANDESLERFAALVAAAEREACAKVCEDMGRGHGSAFAEFDCTAAIRAALAEPAQEPHSKAPRSDYRDWDYQDHLDAEEKQPEQSAATNIGCLGMPVNTSVTPAQRTAKPVQEPFGYLWPTGRHPEFRFTQQKRDGVDGTPVYTAPPQRKPLTEEQIKACEKQAIVNGALPFEQRVFFARAIEKAHGIGVEE